MIEAITAAINSHEAMGPEKGGANIAKAGGASNLGRRSGSPLLQESLQCMDHAGQHLSHLLLPNHINCPSVKLIGATQSMASDVKAFDAINFGSKCADLPSYSPDFRSDTCKLPSIRFPKVFIRHRFDWVRVGHVAL